LKFASNILFDTFWREHETYVNIHKTDETWGPIDKKIYNDDCLDATVYAYICRLTKRKRAQKKVADTKSMKKMVYPLDRDKDGNLTRKPTVCHQTTY
jgi:hypothetical protein